MGLTRREQVERVLRGERGDRIPFTMYDTKVPRCAVERELRNQGLCMVRRDVTGYAEERPHVNVTERTYRQNGKMLMRTEYETPVGTLYTIDERAGFTSWHHKRLFGGPEDYKVLLYLIKDTEFRPNYEAFLRAEADDGGDSFFRSGIGSEPLQALISTYMGTETFCMEWHDRQDEVLQLYEALVEQRRKLYPVLANSPALAFNYGGNVTPEIIGLERFEKYYVGHYNEAAECLHKKGKLLGVHFDANCRLLASAIAGTKLDYIEAFTPAPDTDMTLAEARGAWPDKVLWINFPSSVHLESIETIERVCRDLLTQAGAGERFIMGVTEDIPEDRWQGNLLAISRILSC